MAASSGREEEKEARMAALRLKIREFQKRQIKLEEWKKERELEMARAWREKVEEDKIMKEQERQLRLEQMRQEQSWARKQRQQEHRESQRAALAAESGEEGGDELGQGGAHGWALTSVDDSGDGRGGILSPLPAKYRDKLRIPIPNEEQCRTWKIHNEELPRRPRLPPEACPGGRSRKKAQQARGGLLGQKGAQKGEKSVVHQLPNMFKGLRGTQEGQAILAAGTQGDPNQQQAANRRAGGRADPDESLMPRKSLLRRAQIKLMHQLSDQVQFYRDHMKRNFQRVLAATELEFSDVAGRRQQAAWNLAKPLTISEIKQMSAVKPV